MINVIKSKKFYLSIIIILLTLSSIIIQNKIQPVRAAETLENDECVVYVTGSVENQGMYTFNKNARLNDLINAAGGLKEDADLEKINLALKLKDGEKIVIEAKKNEEEIELDENDGKINIRTADKEKLKEIEGIGDATAEKIISYRNENGIYDIEDLMNIDGIGENKFNKIKEKICI